MDPLPAEFSEVYFRAERPVDGWPGQFAIVTAHNPEGLITDSTVNLMADKELQAVLEQMEVRHFRVTGGSRDGRHQEPGWGVVLNTPQLAQVLSARFRQLAFFWVEADRFSLVDARSGQKTDQAAWVERWLGPEDA